jgi:hypothetical protein
VATLLPSAPDTQLPDRCSGSATVALRTAPNDPGNQQYLTMLVQHGHESGMALRRCILSV